VGDDLAGSRAFPTAEEAAAAGPNSVGQCFAELFPGHFPCISTDSEHAHVNAVTRMNEAGRGRAARER